ncbi:MULTISPECIES: ribosome biogenesis GTPase YqeH [Bacillaceae]|uniref:GTPase n=1 Tax=Alkalicoccobacillus plakortidis TaxID=444060 RepID=A0A9D5I2Q6_9BACI|nr:MULTISPECIES: ribosome biogenesis GTPase YqeH [Bacillaceae]KQL58043.1 GTPase [Alkalicoccobacillus plakortidis]
MSKNEEHYFCSGCGVQIQTSEPKKIGYAPASALTREHVVCKRCFRLTHYNEIQPSGISDQEFLDLIHTLSHKDALIVKIVDVVDLYGSWISSIKRLIGNNTLLLVANKIDLLPKSLNRNKLQHWLMREASQQGLKPANSTIISTVTGEGLDETISIIEEMRKGKDVYIVGSANVGKSSFINQLLKRHGDEKDPLITTSHFPGTTLNMIQIPLDEQQSLYDTPGIINRHQLSHYLSDKSLKLVTPTKEIKPMVYQLNSGQTLFIGGLARLDFIKGEPTSFIVYVSNRLTIHRTKLEKADQLYQNHIGELLQPPTSEDEQAVFDFKSQTFKLKDGSVDIVFSGLGWITIKGAGVTVNAHAPKEVAISHRTSILA